MVTRTERQIVEFLKKAKHIKLEAIGECGTVLRLEPSKATDNRKLFHDIAISVQDYYNNAKRV